MSVITWFVYVLECRDGSLYTGITNDLERRICEHQQGIGSKYTRGRIPVVLLASKRVENRSEALSKEYQLKRLDRKKKLQEIQTWYD